MLLLFSITRPQIMIHPHFHWLRGQTYDSVDDQRAVVVFV